MFKHCFTICIDMDDTIENLLEAWLNYLNQTYNYDVKVEDVTAWGMREAYPKLNNTQIFEVLENADFWKTVKPKKDAVEYIQKLVDEHQDVYIVTAAKYTTVKPKMEEVLLKYFPMINPQKIIIINNKQMLKCDIMIDDNLHNLTGGDYYRILVDMPYNRKETSDIVYRRVQNWKEIYNAIVDLDWVYSHENKSTIF